MCSESNEHSSCSENLEVVPNDELEKRRVLFEICKEDYYDERQRTVRLDGKASSFLIFYSILLNAGVLIMDCDRSRSIITLHVELSFLIASILGLIFAFLSLRIKPFVAPDVSLETQNALENLSTPDVFKEFSRYYSSAIRKVSENNDEKVKCLEVSTKIGIVSVVAFAVILILLII